MRETKQTKQTKKMLILNFQGKNEYEQNESDRIRDVVNQNKGVDMLSGTDKTETKTLENLISTDKLWKGSTYDTVIILGHGNPKDPAKRNTETEQHLIWGPNELRETDFFLKNIRQKIHPKEIAVVSCFGGAIRTSKVPCTITAFASAKYISNAKMCENYIKWRISNSAKHKDCYQAFGASVKKFAITQTLNYYDYNSKNHTVIKVTPPKNIKDIKSTGTFLLRPKFIIKPRKKEEKTNKSYSIKVLSYKNSTTAKRLVDVIRQGMKIQKLNLEEYVNYAIINNASMAQLNRFNHYCMFAKKKGLFISPNTYLESGGALLGNLEKGLYSGNKKNQRKAGFRCIGNAIIGFTKQVNNHILGAESDLKGCINQALSIALRARDLGKLDHYFRIAKKYKLKFSKARYATLMMTAFHINNDISYVTVIRNFPESNEFEVPESMIKNKSAISNEEIRETHYMGKQQFLEKKSTSSKQGPGINK